MAAARPTSMDIATLPARADAIQRMPHRGALPLSFAQQLVWQDAEWSPGHRANHTYTTIHLDGDLNIPLLERCLTEIVARHDILRAAFIDDGDEVEQMMTRRGEWQLPVVDCAPVSAEHRAAFVEERALEEATRAFDLELGPLYRGTVFRLSPREHIVFLVIHHLVSDGLSRRVLLRELTALYAAFRDGKPSPLPPLPIQYADYVLWQRARLHGDRLRELATFWTTHLAGVPCYRRKHLSRASIEQAVAGKQRHAFTLSDRFHRQVAAIGRRERVTPFMLLLWALTAWVAQQRGQDDVVVASSVANRLRLETEALIGSFADVLFFRNRAGDAEGARVQLQHVRRSTLAVYAHDEMPLVLLIEALRPMMAGGHLRCDAFLNVRPWRRFETHLPGLTWRDTVLVAEDVASPLDLNLTLREDAHGSHVTVFYSPGTYDPARIERLGADLEALLARLIAN
jgi:hypothetical protein